MLVVNEDGLTGMIIKEVEGYVDDYQYDMECFSEGWGDEPGWDEYDGDNDAQTITLVMTSKGVMYYCEVNRVEMI
jgi:hypothetical protein|tara:strand:+ start:197 stop:421 length:225 start_codon:yes stop_codon:yes gene_type:complete